MTVGEAYLTVLAFLAAVGLSAFLLTRRYGNRVVATANALLAFVVSAVGVFGLAIPHRHSDQYCHDQPYIQYSGTFPTLTDPVHFSCRYGYLPGGRPNVTVVHFSLLPLAWIVVCSVVILSPIGWTLLVNRVVSKRRRNMTVALNPT